MTHDPDPRTSNAEIFECIAAAVTDTMSPVLEVLQLRRDSAAPEPSARRDSQILQSAIRTQNRRMTCISQ